MSSLVTAGSSACADPAATAPPAPACLDAGADASCTPAYEPTWDAIYGNTLQRSCTLSGVSCHAATGKQAGVDLSDPEVGYASISSKVRPGDPACSILVQRVMSTTGATRMPPGRSLPEGERCAIVRWVANGAHR